MKRRALITGASGQDGSYLIELLLGHDYEVHAQSRRAQPPEQRAKEPRWHAADIAEPDALSALIEAVMPDEIYNLASISRPLDSWRIPHETFKVNALTAVQICETVRQRCPSCRIFQATSSEIFGDSKVSPQSETTPFNPQTPYGVAKLAAHRTIGLFRRNYGLHASSGIMFNHESPRRPLSYVSQKIAHAAAAASMGLRDTAEKDDRGRPILCSGVVQLGDLEVRRDFGYAGDYVALMHRMLQDTTADDYVIGTGVTHSIRELCETAFRHVGLDWQKHVTVDQALIRPVDSHYTMADISKVTARLAWRPTTPFAELVAMMVDQRIALLKCQTA
jgi:GDPmannose 4,6-dehydratase